MNNHHGTSFRIAVKLRLYLVWWDFHIIQSMNMDGQWYIGMLLIFLFKFCLLSVYWNCLSALRGFWVNLYDFFSIEFIIWNRDNLTTFPICDSVPKKLTCLTIWWAVGGSVRENLGIIYALVVGGVSKGRTEGFKGLPQLPTCCLCPLLSDQDVDCHLFLPLCLCSSIMDSIPLKP